MAHRATDSLFYRFAVEVRHFRRGRNLRWAGVPRRTLIVNRAVAARVHRGRATPYLRNLLAELNAAPSQCEAAVAAQEPSEVGAPEGAETYGAYPRIDISRNRFTAPSTSAMFQSMYRAST